MNKSIMIEDLDEIIEESYARGFEVNYISKGPEWDRESLNYNDALRALECDIVILGTSQNNAEEFRIKMEQLREAMDPSKQKDTIICWCMWNDFWRKNGGKYQITTVNESFYNGEINKTPHPSFGGLDASCKKFELLTGEQIEGQQKLKH